MCCAAAKANYQQEGTQIWGAALCGLAAHAHAADLPGVQPLSDWPAAVSCAVFVVCCAAAKANHQREGTQVWRPAHCGVAALVLEIKPFPEQLASSSELG